MHPFNLNLFMNTPWRPVFANDNDALIPELWAQEALYLVEANCMMPHLVHRDFEDEVAKYGQTVHAHIPASFLLKRKTGSDSVVVQDATTTEVDVVMNQHLHTSFMIYDGEETLAFKDLVQYYLAPAMRNFYEGIDAILMQQVYQFIGNNAIGTIQTAPDKTDIINASVKCDDLKMPVEGRYGIVAPVTKGHILGIDDFTHASKFGDGGIKLQKASLGEVMGIDWFMSQNTPNTAAAGATVVITRLVDNATGYPAGTTVLTVDSASATVGAWITIAGDDTPQRITADTGTSITISPGLQSAVLNNAVITQYDLGAVDLIAGYASGYVKEIEYDTFSDAVVAGQGISSAAGAIYGVNNPEAAEFLPDRPLDAALANDVVLAKLPDGTYNFVFCKHALAMVSRPLVLPRSPLALAAVVDNNGIAVRVTITYLGTSQGHLVTIDMLFGTKVLNANMGFPFYA